MFTKRRNDQESERSFVSIGMCFDMDWMEEANGRGKIEIGIGCGSSPNWDSFSGAYS